MWDNPEPEYNYKCFNFEVVVTEVLHGYVWAKNQQEAIDLINKGKWDEATAYPDSLDVEDISTLIED